MEAECNELNDDWIKKFEKTDSLYQDLYRADLYYVNLKFIYVNRTNEIEKIKQESFLLSTPNHILREEIIEMLKKNSSDNGRRYTLLSMLQYNITLDADEVKQFLISSNDSNSYLKVIKNIDAVSFEQTVNMLQDLNDLVFIFYEKSNELKDQNSKNSTKKIYLRLQTTNKKTIKKQYKN